MKRFNLTVIAAFLFLSGCNRLKERLNPKDDIPKGPHVLSCCLDGNGKYPASVPAQHQHVCTQARDACAYNGCSMAGEIYSVSEAQCQESYKIGSGYYVGTDL